MNHVTNNTSNDNNDAGYSNVGRKNMDADNVRSRKNVIEIWCGMCVCIGDTVNAYMYNNVGMSVRGYE